MGTPHLTGRSDGCFGQEAQGGRALNRQPWAMAGQAQGQHPTTDAYVALRQGLRGTGEEKVAAKKPTGKGVLWFGGMAKNLN